MEFLPFFIKISKKIGLINPFPEPGDFGAAALKKRMDAVNGGPNVINEVIIETQSGQEKLAYEKGLELARKNTQLYENSKTKITVK